jgi:hypothetical protein
MAFDYDADACASYETNLGHAPVRLDVRDLVRMARAGWRPSEPIDLLVADPPCTPWSRAGKRQGRGFTVNLSADSLEEVDRLLDRNKDDAPLPATVVLEAGAPDKGIRTPGGRRVVVCPAQTSGTTCAECELCANPFRHSIVGFRSHGQAAALIPEIVRRRRLPVLEASP